MLVRHLLPNAIAPALVAATFGIAAVVLIDASIGFLDLASAGTAATWGEIMGEARGEPEAWWLLAFPGAALSIGLLALHLVGEALRDGLDPRLRDSPDAAAATG